MQCPYCRAQDGRVVDSRSVSDGTAIRRRRACLACGKRFTTYERPETSPRMVVKKDDSREAYSREKILRGMIKACEKRRISSEQLNSVVDLMESTLFDGSETEVAASVIGEYVSQALKELDQVAYVRFTSVYRDFRDVREFLEALSPLINKDGANGSFRSDTQARRPDRSL